MRTAQLLRWFVARSSDSTLERTVGSNRGLAVIFKAMERHVDAEQAGGFAGDVLFVLSRTGGAGVDWTVAICDGSAVSRPGSGSSPVLTVRTGVADFLRMAVGDADASALLLDGRLDIEGDFELSTRLGAMFGRP